MRYLSLFSGIGGFELGIQRVDPTAVCVGFSEIDKWATSIYRRHFNDHKPYGDVTKLNTRWLPDFDLLVGGFPCQAFSMAGKRKGFHDTRGTLFFEITRILNDKRPRYIFLENVRGLLSHQSGETFQVMLEILSDLGYVLQWEVLNSKNYGVPQNRERVFIIGHRRGEPRPEVFPIGEGETGVKDEGQTIMKLGGKAQNDSVYNPKGLSPTLRAGTGVKGRGIGSCNSPKIIAPCIRAEHHNTTDVHFLPGIRRLTPLECERLQGFPDDWTKWRRNSKGISDTQRYKMLGNAVTVNVIEAIYRRLLNA